MVREHLDNFEEGKISLEQVILIKIYVIYEISWRKQVKVSIGGYLQVNHLRKN